MWPVVFVHLYKDDYNSKEAGSATFEALCAYIAYKAVNEKRTRRQYSQIFEIADEIIKYAKTINEDDPDSLITEWYENYTSKYIPTRKTRQRRVEAHIEPFDEDDSKDISPRIVPRNGVPNRELTLNSVTERLIEAAPQVPAALNRAYENAISLFRRDTRRLFSYFENYQFDDDGKSLFICVSIGYVVLLLIRLRMNWQKNNRSWNGPFIINYVAYIFEYLTFIFGFDIAFRTFGLQTWSFTHWTTDMLPDVLRPAVNWLATTVGVTAGQVILAVRIGATYILMRISSSAGGNADSVARRSRRQDVQEFGYESVIQSSVNVLTDLDRRIRNTRVPNNDYFRALQEFRMQRNETVQILGIRQERPGIIYSIIQWFRSRDITITPFSITIRRSRRLGDSYERNADRDIDRLERGAERRELPQLINTGEPLLLTNSSDPQTQYNQSQQLLPYNRAIESPYGNAYYARSSIDSGQRIEEVNEDDYKEYTVRNRKQW